MTMRRDPSMTAALIVFAVVAGLLLVGLYGGRL